MDFLNWKFGLSVLFYALIGVENIFADITPELLELGTPDAGIGIGADVLAGAIDTLSLIAVSVLGLSSLRRPGTEQANP